MKKFFIVLLACVAIFALSSLTYATSLTAIYEFEGPDPAITSFEGLDFTNDGTLWITSAPNFGTPQLLKASLDFAGTDQIKNGTVSAFDYHITETFFGVNTFNPVALASDGEKLFVTSNRKFLNNYMYTLDPAGDLTRTTYDAVLGKNICNDPEGSAYLNGLIYVSCQESKTVIAIDPKTNQVVKNPDGTVLVYKDFANQLLGLAAMGNNTLIIGEEGPEAKRNLLLFDVLKGEIIGSISLNDLFVGAESDYEKITGEAYLIDIENKGTNFRSIPDPDGLAYRDGKIYMTFEHDLRVFEISLNDPPVVTPEPGTVLLLGLGLLGLAAGLRKKRA